MNATRTQSLRSGTRPVSIVAILGAATAAAVFVAVVAFGVGLNGNGGNGGNGGVVPPASPSSPSPAPSDAPSPAPSDRPSQAPTEAPTEAPTAEPTAAPTLEPDPGDDGMPIKVDLETANHADVYVDIVDSTGLLVGAESGTPDEGASVPSYTLQVENLDERTLKLMWTDYPIDNALALYVDRHEGRMRFLLIQPPPSGNTDAIAMDRVLVLTFSEPISADQVDGFLQEGLDTPG